MKIEHIAIDNFQSIRHFTAAIDTPITMFLGGNGAGKSSIQNAIKLAMTRQLTRVDLKKDQAQLVSDGAKKGVVTVTVDGNEMQATVPGLEGNGIASNVLPILLDPHLFAQMSGADRKRFLLELSDVRVSTDLVKERLLSRGCKPLFVDQVMPLVRAGFDAAAKETKAYVSEAKAAWKGIAGENYGVRKAEDWKCETPEFDESELKALQKEQEAAAEAMNAAMEKRARLKAEFDQHAKVSDRRAKLEEAIRKGQSVDVEQHEADKKRLDDLKTELAELRGLGDESTYDCPHCKKPVSLHNGSLLPVQKKAATKEDKARAKELSKEASDLGMHVAMNAQTLRYAEEAKASLADLDFTDPVEEADITALDLEIHNTKLESGKLHAKEMEIAKAQEAAANAAKVTENAKAWHIKAQEYQKIHEALSPGGIPAEILKDAIGPINKRLASSCAYLDWPIIQINNDIEIEWGSRPYGLLSESEQWRCDAVIAEALAKLSGFGLFFLDRFDVLDLNNRRSLMLWLLDLAEKSEIENVFVFGTVKKTSVPSKSSMLTGYWIEKGELQMGEKAA